MRRLIPTLLVTAGLAALLPLRDGAHPIAFDPAGEPRGIPALPLRFESNQGQSDPRVAFVARGHGWSTFLTRDESVLVVRPPRAGRAAILRTRPVGGTATGPVGLERAPGVVHHLHGADPEHWRAGVPTYERVAYRDVWPGVDLVYHGDRHRLEYDFVVAPSGDPAAIVLEIDGAERISIERGDLVLGLDDGRVVFEAPVLHQQRDGALDRVAGRWRLVGERRVGFEVAAYDRTRPLVIDPVLGVSTYLGGSGSEDGFDNMGVAVDDTGIYVTGTTDSADFPIEDALQGEKQGFADAFVTKLDPTGTEVLWSTFLGGAGLDSGQAIAIDATGSAYVAGFTASEDFPTRTEPGVGSGDFDAFVAKLAPDGSSLDFATFLGGSKFDFALGVALDSAGQVWLTGDTESDDFPLANPLQAAIASSEFFDAWVASIDGSDGSLEFSTYFGGAALDSGQDIAVGTDGAVSVTGLTLSTDFPAVNAAQPANNGNVDAFLMRLAPGATSISFSTYIGGEETDRGIGVGLDAFGNAYVVGDTFSGDFPTTLEPFAGFADAFVAKYDATGARVWSTCLGGDSADVGLAVATDASGNSFVTGNTFSLTFPIRFGFQGDRGGDVDAFVAAYDPDGRPRWSSYLGGTDGDRGLGIALDGEGAVWVVGDTFSDDFPTNDPLQPARDGIRDAFVARVPAIEQRVLEDPALRVVQVAAGFAAPMAMAFLGADDLLVLEKDGRVRRVTAGVLDPDPMLRFDVSDADGGPWGLAVHPAFPDTPHVYFLFTAVAGDPPLPVANRVVRARWNGDALVEPTTIAELPGGPDHGQEGGMLAFGPDGRLYVSLGDVGTAGRAQNVATGPAADGSAGVLRLDDDGGVPSDNPFVSAGTGFEPYFAFGVRGPFAMAFDPLNDALWATDDSLGEYDELNLLTPGGNAGWSRIAGPTRRFGPVTGLTPVGGSSYVDPALSWREPIVPRGMTFLGSDALGEQYRDQLFLGGSGDGRIFRLDPDASRTAFDFEGRGARDGIIDGEFELAETVFAIGFGSVAELEVGPDGLLYVLSSTLGRLFRIERRADLDLRLFTTATTALLPGDPLPIRLELTNDSDATQDFGILLMMVPPRGGQLALLGPVDVTLAPHGESSIADLGAAVPDAAIGGRWQVKGTLFRLDSGEVDRARIEFQVIPEPAGGAIALATLGALAALTRRRRCGRASAQRRGAAVNHRGEAL
jgi:glucose/arabinose dehydrogenase